jgi:hypothetical protein
MFRSCLAAVILPCILVGCLAPLDIKSVPTAPRLEEVSTPAQTAFAESERTSFATDSRLNALSHDEVMRLFRSRADAITLREFDQLAEAKDPSTRPLASQLVLSRLTDEELARVGIKTTRQGGVTYWCVATGIADSTSAVFDLLRLAHMRPINVGVDAGSAFYVRKEEFFRAREILHRLARNKSRGITVVTPAFALSW